MNKLSRYFYNKVTLAIATVLTFITFAYLFFVLMDGAECYQVADESVKSLGTSFGYDLEMVQHFLSVRSEAMIICYKNFNIIWDNLFALSYGLMYIAWLSVLYKPFKNKVKLLILFPILQVIFDWLENFQLARISDSYLTEDQIYSLDVNLASSFTLLKWICSSLIFILIVIGIVLRIVSVIKKRKN